MDVILDRLSFVPIQDIATRAVVDSAVQQFYAFTLVVIRLSGLMTIGPLFGQSIIPANVRILMVLTMGLLITPALNDHGKVAFEKLDRNQDGRLTRDEVPEPFARRYRALLTAAGKTDDDVLLKNDLRVLLPRPQTMLDYVRIGIGEFGLGLVLGLGVLTILSGLQLAGEIIDQQSGLALGEVANPGLDITGAISGQFLFTFGTTVLLVMEPAGYHLTIVSALVETFQTVPLGDAVVTVAAIDLVRDLVHQSLVLGIQIAAPILASMSLIGLTMGFLGHTVPQINVMVAGFPVRAVICLMVLITALSGIARAVIDLVPTVIDSLRHALTAL